MRRGTWLPIAIAGLAATGTGCRQLFGIDDTRAASDAGANGAADGPVVDAPANQPDGPTVPDGPPPDARACAATYLMMYGGHRYQLSGGQSTWTNGLASCAADDGYLAIPDDEAEDQWMAQLNQGTVWIGVTDQLTEGNFVTVKGETIPPHYVKWSSTAPNGGTTENCVQILTSSGGNDGTWDDSDCPNSRRYLCECDL